MVRRFSLHITITDKISVNVNKFKSLEKDLAYFSARVRVRVVGVITLVSVFAP